MYDRKGYGISLGDSEVLVRCNYLPYRYTSVVPQLCSTLSRRRGCDVKWVRGIRRNNDGSWQIWQYCDITLAHTSDICLEYLCEGKFDTNECWCKAGGEIDFYSLWTIWWCSIHVDVETVDCNGRGLCIEEDDIAISFFKMQNILGKGKSNCYSKDNADILSRLPVSLPENPDVRLASSPWPKTTNDSNATRMMMGWWERFILLLVKSRFARATMNEKIIQHLKFKVRRTYRFWSEWATL